MARKPPKDATLKLAGQAKKDPSKLTELIDKTAMPTSDKAKQALSKRISFSDEFLDGEAKRFGVSPDRIRDVAAMVEQESGSSLEYDETEFSVDREAREYFAQLFEREIQKRHTCPERVQVEHEEQRHGPDGKPIGAPKMISVWRACGAKFESVQQALVHHALHIMFDSGDPRTKRAMWNDIRELLYPTKEKSLRGALSTHERRKYLEDRKARLVGRGDQL